MTRTRARTVFGLVVLGAVVGFLLETAFAAGGVALLAPPLPFSIALVAVGGIVVGFAVPIARTVRGLSTRPIDPFVAVRVAVLAKACSLGGSLLSGGTAGLLVFLVTRTIVPSGGSVALSSIAVGASVLLLAAALVSEHLCTLPPEDKERNGGDGHA